MVREGRVYVARCKDRDEGDRNRGVTDLEQPESFNGVQLIECEAVVDSCWNHKEVSRDDVNADPSIRGGLCKVRTWE